MRLKFTDLSPYAKKKVIEREADVMRNAHRFSAGSAVHFDIRRPRHKAGFDPKAAEWLATFKRTEINGRYVYIFDFLEDHTPSWEQSKILGACKSWSERKDGIPTVYDYMKGVPKDELDKIIKNSIRRSSMLMDREAFFGKDYRGFSGFPVFEPKVHTVAVPVIDEPAPRSTEELIGHEKKKLVRLMGDLLRWVNDGKCEDGKHLSSELARIEATVSTIDDPILNCFVNAWIALVEFLYEVPFVEAFFTNCANNRRNTQFQFRRTDGEICRFDMRTMHHLCCIVDSLMGAFQEEGDDAECQTSRQQ